MPVFSSNVDAALTQRRETMYEDVVFRLSPALGLMKHGDWRKMGGNAIKATIKSGYSPGVGVTYATAFANIGETQRKAFLVTPNTTYALESVDHDSELYSRGDDNAIVDVLSDAEKSCMQSAALQLDQALFSDGYGTLFTSASHTGTTGTITVTAVAPSDLFKVQVGQILTSKATPAAAALDTGGVNGFTVTQVDAIAGVVTGTTNGAYTAASTDGHVFGILGTMAASTSLITFPGFKAWLTNDPTALSTSFYGVTRQTDRVGLAGHVIDCTGGVDVITSINRVLQSISNYPGAKNDLIFLSSSNNEKLMTLLDNRAVYTDSKGEDIDVLYDGVSFIAGNGKKVTAHVCSACSPSDIFVMDSSTWMFASPGNKMVVPGQPDGTPFVPLISTDSTMVKYKATGFVYCVAPGFNGRAIVNP